MHGLVAILFTPGVGLAHVGLHVLEHVAIIDIAGVLIGNVAAVFVFDGHTPGFIGQRRHASWQDHAQRRNVIWRIAPTVDQQTLSALTVEKHQGIGQVEGRQIVAQDDTATLELQAGDEFFRTDVLHRILGLDDLGVDRSVFWLGLGIGVCNTGERQDSSQRGCQDRILDRHRNSIDTGR